MKSVVKGRMFRAAAVLLCSAGLVVSAAVAQPVGLAAMGGQQQGGGMNPDRMLEILQQRLSLTSDQSTQVKAILTDVSTKIAAARADTSLSSEDSHAQIMTLVQGERSSIRALLTPDQQTIFDQMQSSHGRRGGGMNQSAPSMQQEDPQ